MKSLYRYHINNSLLLKKSSPKKICLLIRTRSVWNQTNYPISYVCSLISIEEIPLSMLEISCRKIHNKFIVILLQKTMTDHRTFEIMLVQPYLIIATLYILYMRLMGKKIKYMQSQFLKQTGYE